MKEKSKEDKFKFYVNGILIDLVKISSIRERIAERMYYLVYDETYSIDIELIAKGVLLHYLGDEVKTNVISRISKDISEWFK